MQATAGIVELSSGLCRIALTFCGSRCYLMVVDDSFSLVGKP